MSEFLYQSLIRLSVMLPTMVITFSLAWYVMKTLGFLKLEAPLDTANLKTWPLSLVVLDAAILAVTMTAILTAMGDSEWSAGVGGGVGAIVSLSLAPRLYARLTR